MAGPYETIKDYLVGLGFKVDDPSLRQFEQKMRDVNRFVEAQTGAMGKSWVKAAGLIVGAMSAITGATVGLMDKAAQADLKFQLFGLRMYMSTDTARKFKVAVDALGHSIDEIAWNPELLERYKSLIQLQGRMGVAGGFESQMKYLRDIRFEFTKMKVEATYALFWIGYYLSKHLGYPLEKFYSWLQGINKWIEVNMPRWTNTVAEWLARLIGLITPVGRLIWDVGSALGGLWEMLPKVGQAFVVLGGILAAVLLTGPIGTWTAAISLALIALQDFYAYLDGRKGSTVGAHIFDGILSALNVVIKSLSVAHMMIYMILTGKKMEGDFLGKLWDIAGKSSPIQKKLEQEKAWAAGKEAPGLARIGGQESGGSYGAVNPLTGARGKYQILPSNWPAWAAEAGLGPNAMMTPENQERVASFKYQQYLKEFKGNEQLVATAWYAGPGVAHMLQEGKLSTESLNRLQAGGYPSINEYIRGVTGERWKGNREINFNLGDINVNVNRPGASAQEIAEATRKEIHRYMSDEILKSLHEMQGVFE